VSTSAARRHDARRKRSAGCQAGSSTPGLRWWLRHTLAAGLVIGRPLRGLLRQPATVLLANHRLADELNESAAGL